MTQTIGVKGNEAQRTEAYMRFNVKAVVETEDEKYDDIDVSLALKDGFGSGIELVDSEVEAQVYRTLERPVRVALSRCVLVVATPGQIGDWAAYIDAVPGKNHDNEEAEVAATGTKVRKFLATALFPNLDPDKYRD